MNYRFKIVGAFTEYPAKMELANAINRGEQPIVKLTPENGKIVAYLNNILCGVVDRNDNGGGLTPYSDIEAIVTSEIVATITRKVGVGFVGSFSYETSLTSVIQGTTTLKAIIEEKIKAGIITQEEVDERLEYANKCGITEKQLKTVFGSMKAYSPEVAKRLVARPKTLYVDDGTIVKRCVAYINKGKNLGFEGDRGVGKNVLAETLAWFYKRPLWEASLNSGADNNSLLGGKTFEDATNETQEESMGFFKSLAKLFAKGLNPKNWFSSSKEEDAVLFMGIFKKLVSYFTGKKIKYEPELIIQAAMYGGFLVLDEFNTLYGHILSVFNSLLDDRRRIHVPGFQTIYADKTFVAISTQNKSYTSTFDTNEATIDRFVPILFPQLKSIMELLRVKFPTLTYDSLNKCEVLYKAMKKNVEDREMDAKTISIRGFIDACEVLDEDIDLEQALTDNIANRAVDEDDRKKIENIISDMF